MVQPLLDSFPPVPGPRGRPRTKPQELYGDRGYGFPWTIRQVRARGIVSRLCPRGSPHGSGLGQVRYVVEQRLGCLGHCRRLKVCYEKHGVYFQAYHDLACCRTCAIHVHQVTGGL